MKNVRNQEGCTKGTKMAYQTLSITNAYGCVPPKRLPLFVFLIGGPKQNAGSLLTQFQYFFYDLSSGTLVFALHGSFNNHLLEII